MERYEVHQSSGGSDRVIGHFTVQNGSIHFDSSIEEGNCDQFPPGPMSARTKEKIQYLLDNRFKTVWLSRA